MADKLELPASPFWSFTLAVYQKEGVSPACIALQDRLGLDVNFLLLCLYAGSRGRALGADDVARLEERVAPWRKNVLHPLRAVRRWLKEQQLLEKAPSDQLRRGVLGYEIESEGVQQRLMEAAVTISEGASSAETAAGNLKTYLAWTRVKAGDADRADLAVLLSQVFPPLSRDQAKALF
ncbi:MAG TPA: TIGR02444 family protein [Stellaceae bacterium]|nr:TIGR02444 family protein [Stellaceae bacterium]